MDNPKPEALSIYHIMQLLGQTGSETDLWKLRQVSEEFNEQLTPHFLDKLDKDIKIQRWLPTFQVFTKSLKLTDGKFLKHIDKSNWNPKMAHLFRKIYLEYTDGNLKFDRDGFDFMALMAQLGPHITTVVLATGFFYANHTSPEAQLNLRNIIHQFTNLQKFIVTKCYEEDFLEHLDEIFQVLRSNVKITMEVTGNHILYYNKYRAHEMNPIEWVFKFHNNRENDEILTLMSELHSAKNVQFRLDYRPKNINFLTLFTQRLPIIFSHANETQLTKIKLSLEFERPDDFPDEATRDCLSKWRPITTKLVFVNYNTTTYPNLHTPTTSWPKLSSLEIGHNGFTTLGNPVSAVTEGRKYHHPLDILKDCPKLHSLDLNLDQDLSIFHDPQKSEQEAIKEYFGGLTELQKLKIRSIGKIAGGNELGTYLKAVVPHDTRISMA